MNRLLRGDLAAGHHDGMPAGSGVTGSLVLAASAAVALAVALLASGCGSSAPDGHAAAARYLAIADAGNQRLDIDFDHLEGPDQGNLPAAQADLRDASATEHRFDQSLQDIRFPPPTEAVAKSLIAVNEARADLTATAARVTSLAGLAGYEKQLTAANVPVENAVTTIRRQLGLPPPTTS